MNKTISLKRAILIAVLAAILVGSAVAAVILSNYQITTTMIVKPAFSMGVFDVDGFTPLTAIDLGQFQWSSEFYFPGHVATPPAQHYFINNTDQVSFYVGFAVSGIPFEVWQHMNFYALIRRGDQAGFTYMAMDYDTTVGRYSFAIESQYNNPDPLTQYAELYLFIRVQTEVPFATYNPILHIIAFDTPTG